MKSRVRALRPEGFSPLRSSRWPHFAHPRFDRRATGLGRHLSCTAAINSPVAAAGVSPLIACMHRTTLRPPEAGPLSFNGQEGSRRGRSFGLAPAFPSAARFYQGLAFYPALTDGVDGDRIGSANFGVFGVGNRGPSGIIYGIKIACVCSKGDRRNARGARFGKIADAEFHVRRIKRQPPISNGRDTQQNRRPA